MGLWSGGEEQVSTSWWGNGLSRLPPETPVMSAYNRDLLGKLFYIWIVHFTEEVYRCEEKTKTATMEWNSGEAAPAMANEWYQDVSSRGLATVGVEPILWYSFTPLAPVGVGHRCLMLYSLWYQAIPGLYNPLYHYMEVQTPHMNSGCKTPCWLVISLLVILACIFWGWCYLAFSWRWL